MNESDLIPLTGAAVFSSKDFTEVNQLADLLFNPTEQGIYLKSEHEFVVHAWIASALTKSHLAQKIDYRPHIYCASFESDQAIFPSDAWIYWGVGQLMRVNTTEANVVTLEFPILSFDQRAALLHQLCVDKFQTHMLTIPLATVKKALEWQSRYCADDEVLAETFSLLQRAANRFALTHLDDKQTTSLEPIHIAEILVDWQDVSQIDLLRATEDSVELKLFLSEQVIGQSHAIEKFSSELKPYKKARFFILAGTPYSGKKTLVERFAQFTHGSSCFHIPFDLSFYSKEADWSSILLPAPHYHKNQSRLSLAEIVSKYPKIIIVLNNVTKNLPLLERLKNEINRSFFQIDNQCVSIANITWMILLDTTTPEPTPSVIQESIFAVETASELSDILYRPSVRISVEENEASESDQNVIVEEVKKQLPESITESACILPFVTLNEKEKKHIINKEIKRIIHSLRNLHDVPIYYQEEIIAFLLNQVNHVQQGFEALHKNLYQQIEHVFLKSLEQGVIADGQVLMLQLNDTGRVLHMVRTSARSHVPQTKLKI